ncbi:MAG: efflux RND transporter periplasmic adaptor subunit [Chlamydiales bacterium]|nr:efflux RND transporter periplasmic adaptor subunit [Chlamydiales bacterium]
MGLPIKRWTRIALTLALISTGCAKKTAGEPPAFPVTVSVAIQEDVPVYLKGVGHLEPSKSIKVFPQVEGIITEVFFEEGAFVEKGTLIITIDSRLYEADLEIAKANLGTQEAAYRLHHDITKRMERLVKEDYVSEVEYEKSLEKLEGTHAQIEKTYAEIIKAEVNLSHTNILALTSGYLGEKFYDAGNFVSPSQHNPLVIINSVTPIEVEFSLPSFHLDEIRKKQEEGELQLKAERPADVENPLIGHLDFIDNTVNPKTGMIKLKGVIPNEDERGWPGEFVRVYLLLETLKDAVIVPTEAVVMGQDEDFVYVVDMEKKCVDMRKVKTGLTFKKQTVIESGVLPGEFVVTDGQLNLHPEAKVEIVGEPS